MYHLLKIRKATKKHLIRAVYFDDRGEELVSTNALRLQFSSTSHSGIQPNRCELVYVFIDNVERRHALHRSDVLLEKMKLLTSGL